MLLDFSLRVLSALIFFFSFFTHSTSGARPNFIILLADDLGYGDLSYYGAPTISTPNLDRMVQEGMRFTQMYSGAPICSSSRSSILTGRLPIRNGVYTSYGYPLDLIYQVFTPWSEGGLLSEEITIPELLRTKNYTSALIGKWHLGSTGDFFPTKTGGFDYFFGLAYAQDEGCPPGYYEGQFMNCTWWQNLTFPPTPLYRNMDIIQQPVNLDTLMARYNQEALQFIENATKANQPFFLYFAYNQVHVPLFASKEFRGSSRRGLYGDAIQEMDHSIGLVLDKLTELGIDKNTFVFFSSDNGPWLSQGIEGGSAGMFRDGKGSTWEGGFREPGIAWWPGKIQPATVNMDITSLMDLFVTFLDLNNISIPNDRIYDGVSLVPALFSQGHVDRDSYFLYNQGALYAVRYKQYKVHYWTRDGFSDLPPEPH